MQLSNENDMMKRTLYYWARLFTNQLARGKSYHTLLLTITINICHFTFFTTPHYHSIYHLYENQTLHRLPPQDDVLEIHFIEMTKFLQAWHKEQLNPLDDILARWLLLLGMVDARKQKVYDDIYNELEVLAMKDERLQQAFDTWQELSQNPDTIIAYHSRLKAIIDAEAKLDYARHKGIEEGLEQVARKMIAKGQNDDEIQEITELPLATIQRLRLEH